VGDTLTSSSTECVCDYTLLVDAASPTACLFSVRRWLIAVDGGHPDALFELGDGGCPERGSTKGRRAHEEGRGSPQYSCVGVLEPMGRRYRACGNNNAPVGRALTRLTNDLSPPPALVCLFVHHYRRRRHPQRT
jgi:hypothetical protein